MALSSLNTFLLKVFQYAKEAKTIIKITRLITKKTYLLKGKLKLIILSAEHFA